MSGFNEVIDYDAAGGSSLRVTQVGASGTASSIKLEDKTTSANKAAVDSSGQVSVSDGVKSYTTDSIRVYDGASTAATSSVGQSATSVTLVSSNSNRSSCVIYNDSTSELKIVYGATASSTTYTYIIPAQSGTTTFYFEMPKRYTGVIAGIWAGAGAGNARITELSY